MNMNIGQGLQSQGQAGLVDYANQRVVASAPGNCADIRKRMEERVAYLEAQLNAVHGFAEEREHLLAMLNLKVIEK